MKCPYCGIGNDESNKFCRKCGKSIVPNDTITVILPTSSKPGTATVTRKFKGPSNKPQKKETGKKPEEATRGPNLDLRLIRKSSVKFALAFVLLTPIVHLCATFLSTPPQDDSCFYVQDNQITPSKCFLQALMALLFLALIFTPLGIRREGKIPWSKIAQDSFHQFLKGWSAIWISWLVLYLYLGIIWFIVKSGYVIANTSAQITVDFLNVFNSAIFLYIFLVLDMPSVSTETEPNRNKEFRNGMITVSIICLIVFLLSALGRLKPRGIFELGVYLSGILVAISMSYVVGRLDSHHMNVKRGMLSLLYLYAVIQVIGPKLVNFCMPTGTHSEIYPDLFFGAALVLKLYLFVVITYWLQDGSFEQYFNAASNYIEDKRRSRII
jgi:hypothetical protein